MYDVLINGTPAADAVVDVYGVQGEGMAVGSGG